MSFVIVFFCVNILAKLTSLLRFPFQVSFCKATCSTGTTEKRSGCPCKTAQQALFKRVSLWDKKQTLSEGSRSYEHVKIIRKLLYVVVCCHWFELQIKETFWYYL